VEEHTSPRSNWRKLEYEPARELTEANLSEEKLSNSSVMRLQNWSLQQGGKLRPQEMEKQQGGSR
jgi:hypothetical protein